MRPHEVIEIVRGVKLLSDLAWLLGYGIGKATRKKPPKRALIVYYETATKA